jgi:hypothetical protein
MTAPDDGCLGALAVRRRVLTGLTLSLVSTERVHCKTEASTMSEMGQSRPMPRDGDVPSHQERK